MVLAECVTYLVAQSIGFTAATNLFYHRIPESAPDIVAVLKGYGGLPNEPKLGKAGINFEFPFIQAITRGIRDDADGPYTMMASIVEAFARIGDTDLGGVRYGAIIANHPPVPLRQDDNFRWEFVCNFRVTKDYSA